MVTPPLCNFFQRSSSVGQSLSLPPSLPLPPIPPLTPPKNVIFLLYLNFFQDILYCIGASFHTRQEIQFLPYAGFFKNKIANSLGEFLGFI